MHLRRTREVKVLPFCIKLALFIKSNFIEDPVKYKLYPLVEAFLHCTLLSSFFLLLQSCRCSTASHLQNTTPTPTTTEQPSLANSARRSLTGPTHTFGEFQYSSAEGFEAYLKELGVSSVLRTMAGWATPVVTVTRVCPGDGQENFIEVRQLSRSLKKKIPLGYS